MKKIERLTASFRDPNGFLFKFGDILYRQINSVYMETYDQLHSSGLYDALVREGLLIPSTIENIPPADPKKGDLVLKPEFIPFISYPYEWSFSQFKDAALATLRIQKMALDHGLILKDVCAYNIQFHPVTGKPTLIDLLSFEIYTEGIPWKGYRQFCQHFLAPIALIATKDAQLGRLSSLYMDGIPLDLCAKLLPSSTHLNFGLLTHIHMHAAAEKRYAAKPMEPDAQDEGMRKHSLLSLLDNLKHTVEGLNWDPSQTQWIDYVRDQNYSDAALAFKKNWVQARLLEIGPETAWDLGANTGTFSRIAAECGIRTLAFDIDPGAVEKNYLQVRAHQETNILPLVLDLTNPSPGLGWVNRERDSIIQRGPAGAVLALSLVHHLAIANNLPLYNLAEFFACLTDNLLIEFAPRTDSQVQRLLASRHDTFPDYSMDGFESAFAPYFEVLSKQQIPESERILYQMKKWK